MWIVGFDVVSWDFVLVGFWLDFEVLVFDICWFTCFCGLCLVLSCMGWFGFGGLFDGCLCVLNLVWILWFVDVIENLIVFVVLFGVFLVIWVLSLLRWFIAFGWVVLGTYAFRFSFCCFSVFVVDAVDVIDIRVLWLVC